MIETLDSMASVAQPSANQTDRIVERLYAAVQPGAVFGAPVVSGEYTVITASEVAVGGGYGFGSGSGPAHKTSNGVVGATGERTAYGGGGGGAGGSVGRPIAAIVLGPDGVKIKPIVDATKIALAALAAWSAIGVLAIRFSRARAQRT